jgi:hypothetical protein
LASSSSLGIFKLAQFSNPGILYTESTDSSDSSGTNNSPR